MRGKTTKRSVDALKPDRSNDVFLWDCDARGFGVRVKPGGARSFVVAYYSTGLHRVRRRVTLGAYGPLTVDRARAKATALLARVVNGEDPARQKADVRRAAKEETVAKLFVDVAALAEAHAAGMKVVVKESLANGRLANDNRNDDDQGPHAVSRSCPAH